MTLTLTLTKTRNQALTRKPNPITLTATPVLTINLNPNPNPNSHPYARHHLVDALQLPPVAPAGEPNPDPTPSLHINTSHSNPIQLYPPLTSCQPIANPQVLSLTDPPEKPYPKQSLEQHPKPPPTPIPPKAQPHPRLNPRPDLPYTCPKAGGCPQGLLDGGADVPGAPAGRRRLPGRHAADRLAGGQGVRGETRREETTGRAVRRVLETIWNLETSRDRVRSTTSVSDF